MYVAPNLSHHSVGTEDFGTHNSRNNDSSHVSSTTVSARALYSDSVDDRDTVRCLRADHDTKFEPRYIANPPVHVN